MGEPLRAPRFERLRLWSANPMRIAVSLESGDWLVIESVDNYATLFYGAPPGLRADLLSVIVAALALLALWRGLSPLNALASSMECFAANLLSEHTKPRGSHEAQHVIEATNKMQADLSRLIEERQVMFGALSHDLCTYLTRLKLRMNDIPGEKMRADAERDLNEMGDIIEDALLLPRLENTVQSAPEKVDVERLIEGVAMTTGIPPPAAIQDGDAGPVIVRGDLLALRRAIQNLIENARIYAGDCELTLSINDTHTHINVMDRGPGIPSTDRERLLAPFQRGDAARSLETPGTGLGLTIATRAAERCGGRLRLLDRPGGGLIAQLALPIDPFEELPRSVQPNTWYGWRRIRELAA